MAEKRRLESVKLSKESRRRLNLHIKFEWGTYNINFPTFGNPGVKEIHEFMQALEKYSTYPQIVASRVHQFSKLEILQRLLHDPVKNDITVISTGDRRTGILDTVLRERFETPILYRAEGSSDYPNITGFLKRLSEHGNKKLHVYDCSVEDPSQRTRPTTVEYALQCFPSKPDSHALNFLDIEHRDNTSYCPWPVSGHDIRTRIADHNSEEVGKVGSNWRPDKSSEFFLLSTRNAVSSIHVDNGGQLTWIKILEGRKIWYFPRCLGIGTLRLLAETGSQYPEYYRGGWVKVELCVGDVLIMPPGCPHAVFTPEDCLAVGGHFWTAAFLGYSLEVLNMQEKNPSICNEDIYDSIYEALGNVIRNCDSVLSPVETAEVLASSSLFITDIGSLTTPALRSRLQSQGVVYNSSSSRKELIALLKNCSSSKFYQTLTRFKSDHQKLFE